MPNYLKSIGEYSTKELLEELQKREAVEKYTVAPHKEYSLTIDENWEGNKDSCNGEGSAVILIITD